VLSNVMQVAIIGCGWAGRRHARASEGCGAAIRWLVDIDLARAEALRASLRQGEVQTSLTCDYHEALDDPGVDAVTICLPHALHRPVTVAAAAARKHILCEKPIACSLAEADEMILAAESARVVLMIAENVRFSRLFRRVGQLLQDGTIGKPVMIQITRQAYLTRSFLEERTWFLDKASAGGGIMMSGGIHDFEAMHMLMGEIESIYALRAPQRFPEMEGDDTSIATVRFCNGAVGVLVESFVMKSLVTAAGSEIHTLQIDGELGSLAVADGHTIQLYSEREGLSFAGNAVQHALYVTEEDTFLLENQHFFQAIRTGAEPLTSGWSQRRPLEVVLAAYQSMESANPIRLTPRPARPSR
jgi:predicted dehydrogenase